MGQLGEWAGSTEAKEGGGAGANFFYFLSIPLHFSFIYSYLLVTCSQMLYIKNKATQLLVITDLCLLKHYLRMSIMLIRRRSKEIPSFNM